MVDFALQTVTQQMVIHYQRYLDLWTVDGIKVAWDLLIEHSPEDVLDPKDHSDVQ